MDYDVSRIEEAYGFKIKNMEKIRNIYRLETDCGVKSCKRAHMSPSFFMFMDSVVNHLMKKGFDGVIPYSRTVDGGICIPDGKYIYYVVDWVESREAKFKDGEDLKNVIKTAADFHRAAIGYVAPEGAKPRVLYNKWIERFEKKCIELLQFSKTIEDKEPIDTFDEIFAKDLRYYWHQGKQCIQMLKESAYTEISAEAQARGEFCHHDMANHNFLITPEDKIYVIDFDYCIMDTRLHDAASLILRNMRHGVWDIRRAYKILHEYNKHYTLTQKELQVMKAFMVFPQDFWQVGLQRYAEKQPWTEDYFLARLVRCVDDKQKREKFLREFLKF